MQKLIAILMNIHLWINVRYISFMPVLSAMLYLGYVKLFFLLEEYQEFLSQQGSLFCFWNQK